VLDPVTLAMPLAKRIEEHILGTKRLPNGGRLGKPQLISGWKAFIQTGGW